MQHDPVNHPAHYTAYPVQPIEITRHLGFCLGNVVKYVLRAPHKGGVEDLQKALRYLELEDEKPFNSAPSDWKSFSDALHGLVEGLIATPGDAAIWQTNFLLSLEDYFIELWRPEGANHYVRSATASRQRMEQSIRVMLTAWSPKPCPPSGA